jgi:hypothetical protein
MEEGKGPAEDRATGRRWRWPFTWLGLLALCFVVYELTHQPALGAVAVCLKFGWEDFRVARWLSRRDPYRTRGRCCSWLYFAWGLWKTAIVAFVMSVAFAAVAPNRIAQAGAADVLMAFLFTFLTTLVGLGLSTFATFLAVVLAWRHGLRLWLDRAVHDARRCDCWPPSTLCEGRTNRIGQLLLTSVALPVLGGTVLGLVLIGGAIAAGSVAALLVSGLSLLAPVAICLVREALSERIAARRPSDCWGAGPVVEESAEDGFEPMRW